MSTLLGIRERLEQEMRRLEAEMARFKPRLVDERVEDVAPETSSKQSLQNKPEPDRQDEQLGKLLNRIVINTTNNNNNPTQDTSDQTDTRPIIDGTRSSSSGSHSEKHTMSGQDPRDTPLGTPLSSASMAGDPLTGLATNRATTTERRTTTTTTTKRTIKSGDDFLPAATDIQQVRSESRTGSVSSTSPLYNAAASQARQQQQQQRHLNSSSTTSTTTTSSSGQHHGSSSSSLKNWSDGLSSPVIQDNGEGGRVLKLRFDVSQYEPDEIVVKTVDNRLTVHAKHEEKSENKSVYREYNREFQLPEGVDVEQIRSSLSKDGVLTVDCPLPTPQLHGPPRRIPIEKL